MVCGNAFRRGIRRNEHKSSKPPDLSAHHRAARERDHGIDHAAKAWPDIHEDIYDALTDGDVFHQVRDGIAAQLALQIVVDGIVVQGKTLLCV